MSNWLDGLKLFDKDFRMKLEIEDLARNWKELYPKIDIRKQLVAAHAWVLSNPQKAPKFQKTRFINAWMKRAQEWADSSPAYTEPIRPVKHLPDVPQTTQEELNEMHRQTIKALGPRMCKIVNCEVCGK